MNMQFDFFIIHIGQDDSLLSYGNIYIDYIFFASLTNHGIKIQLDGKESMQGFFFFLLLYTEGLLLLLLCPGCWRMGEENLLKKKKTFVKGHSLLLSPFPSLLPAFV